MLIIYKKSDKEIVRNTGKSFVEPDGPSDENGKLAVMERIGGNFDDYGTFRLNDIKDKTKVDEILKYSNYISLVFKDDKAIDYEVNNDKYNQDKIALEEKKLIESLKPSSEEILKAETELQIIELLMEVKLI